MTDCFIRLEFKRFDLCKENFSPVALLHFFFLVSYLKTVGWGRGSQLILMVSVEVIFHVTGIRIAHIIDYFSHRNVFTLVFYF